MKRVFESSAWNFQLTVTVDHNISMMAGFPETLSIHLHQNLRRNAADIGDHLFELDVRDLVVMTRIREREDWSPVLGPTTYKSTREQCKTITVLPCNQIFRMCESAHCWQQETSGHCTCCDPHKWSMYLLWPSLFHYKYMYILTSKYLYCCCH